MFSLCNLGQFYEERDNKYKREVVGSIFPEKLTFDGKDFRTARMNEAAEVIYSLDEGFSKNKTGQTEANFDLSSLVTRPGFEPRLAESESDVLPLHYRAILSRKEAASYLKKLYL